MKRSIADIVVIGRFNFERSFDNEANSFPWKSVSSYHNLTFGEFILDRTLRSFRDFSSIPKMVIKIFSKILKSDWRLFRRFLEKVLSCLTSIKTLTKVTMQDFKFSNKIFNLFHL